MISSIVVEFLMKQEKPYGITSEFRSSWISSLEGAQFDVLQSTVRPDSNSAKFS